VDATALRVENLRLRFQRSPLPERSALERVRTIITLTPRERAELHALRKHYEGWAEQYRIERKGEWTPAMAQDRLRAKNILSAIYTLLYASRCPVAPTFRNTQHESDTSWVCVGLLYVNDVPVGATVPAYISFRARTASEWRSTKDWRVRAWRAIDRVPR
jgi:hypothetical protein